MVKQSKFRIVMQRLVSLLITLVAVARCAPIDEQTPVPILKQSQDGPNPDGSYSWSYETGDGTKAQESGHLRNVGTENEGMVVEGGYSYYAPDGTLIQLTYTADENGFRPQGAHLPTPPPIPDAILKALEYNAAHPEEDDLDGPKFFVK